MGVREVDLGGGARPRYSKHRLSTLKINAFLQHQRTWAPAKKIHGRQYPWHRPGFKEGGPNFEIHLRCEAFMNWLETAPEFPNPGKQTSHSVS